MYQIGDLARGPEPGVQALELERVRRPRRDIETELLAEPGSPYGEPRPRFRPIVTKLGRVLLAMPRDRIRAPRLRDSRS